MSKRPENIGDIVQYDINTRSYFVKVSEDVPMLSENYPRLPPQTIAYWEAVRIIRDEKLKIRDRQAKLIERWRYIRA